MEPRLAPSFAKVVKREPRKELVASIDRSKGSGIESADRDSFEFSIIRGHTKPKGEEVGSLILGFLPTARWRKRRPMNRSLARSSLTLLYVVAKEFSQQWLAMGVW